MDRVSGLSLKHINTFLHQRYNKRFNSSKEYSSNADEYDNTCAKFLDCFQVSQHCQDELRKQTQIRAGSMRDGTSFARRNPKERDLDFMNPYFILSEPLNTKQQMNVLETTKPGYVAINLTSDRHILKKTSDDFVIVRNNKTYLSPSRVKSGFKMLKGNDTVAFGDMFMPLGFQQYATVLPDASETCQASSSPALEIPMLKQGLEMKKILSDLPSTLRKLSSEVGGGANKRAMEKFASYLDRIFKIMAIQDLDSQVWDNLFSLDHADQVFSIACDGLPQCANPWLQRKRYWPPEELLKTKRFNYHLVPKTSRGGDPDIEWAISFVEIEGWLMDILDPVQQKVFFMFKAFCKDFLPQDPEGLSSYHLKTVFFWTLERSQPGLSKEENISAIFLTLLDALLHRLVTGQCQHYFLPQINLFENIPSELLRTTAEVLSEQRSLKKLKPPLYITVRPREGTERGRIFTIHVGENPEKGKQRIGKGQPTQTQPISQQRIMECYRQITELLQNSNGYSDLLAKCKQMIKDCDISKMSDSEREIVLATKELFKGDEMEIFTKSVDDAMKDMFEDKNPQTGESRAELQKLAEEMLRTYKPDESEIQRMVDRANRKMKTFDLD